MGYIKKSSTKRGRSQDRKLISITSPHERAYLKKIAKKLVRLCNGHIKHCKKKSIIHKIYFFPFPAEDRMSTSSVLRIAKALLKCLRSK